MQDSLTSTGRPRRTTRAPARIPQTKTASPPPQHKRKARDLDPSDRLDRLLKSPKSALTSVDISEIINSETWNCLSFDSRAILSTLLPPTAFLEFQASIEPHHPSCRNRSSSSQINVDHLNSLNTEPAFGSSIPSSDAIDLSFFTDPHFLAAAHTFQDHLYSEWMSDRHAEKVEAFKRGIRDGSLHAPWKDDVWGRDHPTLSLTHHETPQYSPSSSQPESSARAGEAAELKLIDLVKNAILKTGDVIAYKRNFTNLDLVIEKDVIIQSIHPKTHVLTVLLESGTTQYLPKSLLSPEASEPSTSTQKMVVSSPTMLETGLLDIDGRVDRSRRPHGNAWKNFTVWRWREIPDFPVEDTRAGRENHGTLFYLRGCYYHDR